jgi:hypothetical protein
MDHQSPTPKTIFLFYLLGLQQGFCFAGRVKLKTMKLVFVAFPLSTQHKEKEQRLIGSESG